MIIKLWSIHLSFIKQAKTEKTYNANPRREMAIFALHIFQFQIAYCE